MKFTKRSEAHEFYKDILSDAEKEDAVIRTMADLERRDLFFLFVRLPDRKDIDCDTGNIIFIDYGNP